MEKDILIITGGKIDETFAKEYLQKESFGHIIAVDKGLETADRFGLVPDDIVGDFDTVDQKVLARYQGRPGVEILAFRPEKDLTDTQIAVEKAFEILGGTITVLGATGTRVDHMLANLFLMEKALVFGRDIFLVDDRNRIHLADRGFSLKRSEAFGDYLSLIPLSDTVYPVTLRGVKYPLTRHTMKRSESGLGVSNEIVDSEAFVEFENGILIVIEAKD